MGALRTVIGIQEHPELVVRVMIEPVQQTIQHVRRG
jgi:hypothetical protein